MTSRQDPLIFLFENAHRVELLLKSSVLIWIRSLKVVSSTPWTDLALESRAGDAPWAARVPRRPWREKTKKMV